MTYKRAIPDHSRITPTVVSAPEEGEEPETIFITLGSGDELKSDVPFSLTIMPGAVFK